MLSVIYCFTTNGFITYTQNKKYGKNHRSLSCSSKELDKQNICIIGGGFGGLYTAIQIEKLLKKHDSPNVNIYLFDYNDKFTFRPLLYELAFGYAAVTEVSPRFDQLLQNTGIKYVQSNVLNINPDSRYIEYKEIEPTGRNKNEEASSLKSIQYDQCVISVGTQPRVTVIPGAEKHALTFYSVEDVYLLQNKLRSLIDSQSVINNSTTIKLTIIGAGYSGVEVAANAAEYIKKMNRIPLINLIDRNDKIMHTSPTHNQMTADK